ncbi:MAG: hypothetical protein Q9228_005697, partial [Teloschistes exilis]
MRRFVRRILKSSFLQRLTAIPRYWRSDELTHPPSSRLEQKVPTPKLLRPFVRPLIPKKQSQEERDRARNKARVAEKNIVAAKRRVAEKKRVAEKQRAAEEQRAAEKQHVAEKQPANVGAESSVARPLDSAASVSASSDEPPSVPATTSIEGTASAHIRRCEQQLGYQFQNPSLLWEALHCNDPNYHAAVRKGGRLADGNKRLALVGDRVLDLMLTMKWYHTWEDRGELELHLTLIDGDPDR